MYGDPILYNSVGVSKERVQSIIAETLTIKKVSARLGSKASHNMDRDNPALFEADTETSRPNNNQNSGTILYSHHQKARTVQSA